MLFRSTSGEIYLGEDLLNEILPRDRQIAMAFQNYALYKHFNVYDNMALGLKLRNMPKNVIDSRVKTAAEFLGIGNILDKKIKAITDSQKQKAALGRAIVFQPKALLLDEDFAQNNEKLRSEMLRDVKRIHRKLGMTILYVTNDYDEAITLATKVVFMKDGEITEVK